MAAFFAPGTRLGPARDGLFLMGLPLILVGAVLQALDWMASYTNTAQGSWDHHVNRPSSRPQRSGRKRRRRLGLFGSPAAGPESHTTGGRLPATAVAEAHTGLSQGPAHGFADSAAAPMPEPEMAPVSPARPAVAAVAARPAAVAAPPLVDVVYTARPAHAAHALHGADAANADQVAHVGHVAHMADVARTRAAETAPQPALRPQVVPVAAAPKVAPPAVVQALRPEAIEWPAHARPADPGPDTEIEEFVGYEGQDRMLALRDAPPPPPTSASPPPPPPPRELAWPNPPRLTVVDAAPQGTEVFLEQVMDDVLAKLGTATGRVARALEATPGADTEASAEASRRMDFSTTMTAVTLPSGPGPAGTAWGSQPTPPSPYPFHREAAPLPPAETPSAAVWTRQVLENTDHWRFAAVVEKLYQQAGFATQLQAGHSLRGVVVLWLFSRHRPGMPASVVSCVHSPGMDLAAEEILTVAELVKSRGLPRGQLATTATVDAGTQYLASARGVHLMDTNRLLELIQRRSPEQQRALADRLV